MKKINIIYWLSTGLILAMMLLSGVMSIINGPKSIEMMHDHLGYPNYFTVFLGVAKILGIIAILVPGFPKLKEWVYAGFTFDLLGATYSFIAVKDPISSLAFFPVLFALLIVSYIYFHKKLAAKASSPA
ncbi:DoxX family protein [Mucilaginibacter flavidus]|uniref:DoxX family protein n=1 Tax=Mucilaginibacter flavidus TaxID=2949309 RepID=UPI002093152D|nr:DoxX family protein [Mucilaginibacter flavidus]MCO5950273.1 DoxX family protein [Mucilaginibacter flavidus]